MRSSSFVAAASVAAAFIAGCASATQDQASVSASNHTAAGRTDLERALSLEVAAASPGAQRVQVFDGQAMSEDEEHEFGRTLRAGDACYVIVGVADDDVSELALYLYGPNGDRVNEAKDSSRPVLDFCPEQTGRYKLKAKVASGEGRFKIGLYSQDLAP